MLGLPQKYQNTVPSRRRCCSLARFPLGKTTGPPGLLADRLLEPDPLLLHLRPGQYRARVPVQPDVVHQPLRVEHPQEREEQGHPYPPREARDPLYLRLVSGECNSSARRMRIGCVGLGKKRKEGIVGMLWFEVIAFYFVGLFWGPRATLVSAAELLFARAE